MWCPCACMCEYGHMHPFDIVTLRSVEQVQDGLNFLDFVTDTIPVTRKCACLIEGLDSSHGKTLVLCRHWATGV